MSYARMKSPFAYMSLLGVFFRLTFIPSQKKKKKMERVIATIIHTLFLSIVEQMAQTEYEKNVFIDTAAAIELQEVKDMSITVSGELRIQM